MTDQQQAWQQAEDWMGSEVERLKRRADDLLTYVYGVVYEGEALDREELDGYVGSVTGELAELTSSAYAVADAADPQQKELREWRAKALIELAVEMPGTQVRLLVEADRDSWHVRRQVLSTPTHEARWERQRSDRQSSPTLREALGNAASMGRGWALDREWQLFEQMRELRGTAYVEQVE